MLSGGPPGPAPGLPLIGQTLGGKYEVVRLLGEGGMAFVFEAHHKRLEQRFAIKVLAPELASDREIVARFEREARAVARLRTKHVVRVIDVGATPDGIPYIVMEFLQGRDLDGELQARTRLPLGESIDVVLQACSGMLEAHAMGIVHRDLKPANLFLATGREGEERVVKVLDFGISKILGEATRLTGAGAVIGTVLYMSPEQLRAEANVDVRADIWSLGVILFELLAGRAPFEGSSAQIAASVVSTDSPDLRSFADVPESVALTIRRMLERDRTRRFASVTDVVMALAPFAPLGSLGAGIAEKLAPTGAGLRGKTALLVMKRTVPMAGAPGLGARPPSSGARTSEPDLARAPHAPVSQGVPPASAAPATPGRFLMILAIAIGLLGATGAVLALVAVLHRAKPSLGTEAAAASAPVVSAQPEAVPPAVSGSAAIVPVPPSTGTTAQRLAPSANSGRATQGAPAPAARRDAGAARPGPAATAVDGVPGLL